MTGRLLRICIICPHFPPNDFACGVGDYTRHVADGLTAMGHQVTVLASTGHRGGSGRNIIRFAQVFNLGAGIRFLNFVRRNRFDLINMQHTPALYGFWFRMAACIANLFTPVVISFHTLHGGTLLSKVQVMMLLLFCRGFISTNEEISWILRRLPLVRKDFAEIPVGSNIEPEGRRPSRAEAKMALGITDNRLVISNFGLYIPGRGLETLLEACKKIMDQSITFRLYLLGTFREIDNEYIGLVKGLTRRFGLQEQVVFTGSLRQEAISMHMFASDLYCVPYDRGASIRRTTLITAIEHGCAAITTFPEIPSQYFDERSEAFAYVPARDPEALAAKILNLWADPAARKKLETRVTLLRPRFQWEAIGRDLERELHRILGE